MLTSRMRRMGSTLLSLCSSNICEYRQSGNTRPSSIEASHNLTRLTWTVWLAPLAEVGPTAGDDRVLLYFYSSRRLGVVPVRV